MKKENKERIIHFRITETQYNQLQTEAEQLGINVNELAKRKVFNTNLSCEIPPSILYTLRCMYDMLENGVDSWNEKTAENYRKGMDRLYAYSRRN